MACQYTYLGFIFVPSSKKQIDIEERQKNMIFKKKMSSKSKEKTIGTCLKSIEY